MHQVNSYIQQYHLIYGTNVEKIAQKYSVFDASTNILQGIGINGNTYAVSDDKTEICCLRRGAIRMYYCDTQPKTWRSDLRHFLKAEIGQLIIDNRFTWQEYLNRDVLIAANTVNDFYRDYINTIRNKDLLPAEILTVVNSPKYTETETASDNLLTELFVKPNPQEVYVVLTINGKQEIITGTTKFVKELDPRCSRFGYPPFTYLQYGDERHFLELPEYCFDIDDTEELQTDKYGYILHRKPRFQNIKIERLN